MKKSLFYFLPILCLLVSCSGDNSLISSKSNDETFGERSTSNPDDPEDATDINCAGSCPERKCYARFLLQEQSFDCLPCSDCKMVISQKIGNGEYQYKSDFVALGEKFAQRMVRLHQSQEAKITNVVMQHSGQFEFIFFEYYTSEEELELFSVGYLSEITGTGDPVGPPTEVDCHGDCGENSTQICTEVFNTRTKEIYCKCQSDSCQMTISE